MDTKNLQNVVITGAGSGLGRALALEFRNRDFTVYATDLNPEPLEEMAHLGIRGVQLDVNSADDIVALVRRLEEDGVSPDILINNAGIAAIAPLAEISLDRLRLQFETNVFSIIALCQAVIPSMVKKGGGRIVNIGSISGIMTSPFAGAYCATKSAVHALSSALRMELAPFGIKVITMQPGGIRSNFGAAAARGVAEQIAPGSLYYAASDAMVARAQAGQENAAPAEDVARQMIDAVLADNPAPVVRMGAQSVLLPLMQRYLPTRTRERILSSKFQLDRIKAP